MLKTYSPISPLLQQYIELFYVFNNAKPEKFSYVAFPHINTAISFFKGAAITRQDFDLTIQPSEHLQHTCVEILGKYTQPVFVHYKGDFEEIAIIFKPSAVNHFIREEFAAVAPLCSQQFNNEQWATFAKELFGTIEDERLPLLEQFLLNQFIPKNQTYITAALKYLEDTNNDYSIENIATILKINLKTFQRNFLKQMGCSALEYKRIARFRHALETKILSKEVKSFTNLSYESNYYDQSYFIREFKKLTNLNPKKFFGAITVLDEQKIVWEIK